MASAEGPRSFPYGKHALWPIRQNRLAAADCIDDAAIAHD
jgi:hypothetical protein